MRHNLALNHVEEIFEAPQCNLTIVSKKIEAANQPLFTKKRPRRRSKQKFNIDVESFLALTSCHVYWKDLDGTILGCNELQATNYGAKKSIDLLGKTDFDMQSKNIADTIIRNDQEVMRTGCKTILETVKLFNGQMQVFLSHKMPLCDLDGNVIGVFGQSFLLDQQNSFTENRGFFVNKLISSIVEFENGRLNVDGITLAKRETECLYYLVRGMSAKQIANQLTLSYRTVEYYLEQLKNKLNCYSRSDLIEKAIMAGFANFTNK